MVSIHSCTDGTSAWQYEHQWARKSIALALPFFSSATISEFSFGPENVGAGRPIATLSSFSPAYVGKTSPVTLVSPSGRPAVKGSELNVTPTATARPITKSTPAAIKKFLFNVFSPCIVIIQERYKYS